MEIPAPKNKTVIYLPLKVFIMYVCENCGYQSKKGEKQNSVIIKNRQAYYPFRKGANVYNEGGSSCKSNDEGGSGLEAVKEVKLCDKCAKKMT